MKTLSIILSAIWFVATSAAISATDAAPSTFADNLLAIAAVIGAIMSPAVVVALALINRKVNKVHTTVTAVDTKVDKVAVEVDGKLEKMVALTRDKFHAEGFKEATDAADKEKAASDAGELKAIKNQQLKDQRPPST